MIAQNTINGGKMSKQNRFICDICGKSFPLTVNGFSKYYTLYGRAVCEECYNKNVRYYTAGDYVNIR